MKRTGRGGRVYSTEHGRMCPACGQPVAQCVCRKGRTQAIAPGDGIVRISRQTKGRKGKAVTVITGVPLGHDDLARLATRLKQKCGAGGTVKARVIEIQGDHRDLLVAELIQAGYIVKRVGG
ncbi:MAG: translation initiation factor Sui1 [Sedimentisphaerales bacterium]|nr:translation initiation factor Sui1 [Sedimentisphaerales bacterium]